MELTSPQEEMLTYKHPLLTSETAPPTVLLKDLAFPLAAAKTKITAGFERICLGHVELQKRPQIATL